jgi:hypothetical protein
MKINLFSNVMIAVLVLACILMAAPVQAQNPAPPGEQDQSWNPPEDGGETFMPSGAESKSSSTYYQPPQPGMLPHIQGAYFIDESGQIRTRFSGEPFYMVVETNSPGFLYIAEYCAPECGRSPEWLMYRYSLGHAGSWTLGPFYPESSEPAGRHTWRLWLFSSGKWANAAAGFDYQPYYRTAAPPVIPEPGGWGTLQVVIIAALAGALGITTGMLIAGRNRYNR